MSTIKLGNSGIKLGSAGITLGGKSVTAKNAHPFDSIEYTGNDEVDTTQEFNAIQSGFMERNKREQERFFLATDTEYWCCLVFQTRDQKEQFLQAMKWIVHGDKYIDGVKVAKSLNVELNSVKVPYNTSEGKSVTQNLKDLT
jgi:hypothetical protein